jgi:hypothetical protein
MWLPRAVDLRFPLLCLLIAAGWFSAFFYITFEFFIWFLTNEIMSKNIRIPEKAFIWALINNLKAQLILENSVNSKPPRQFINKSNEVKKNCSKSLAIKTSLLNAIFNLQNIDKISSMQKIKFHSFCEQFSDHHKNLIYCMLRRVLIHLLVWTFPIDLNTSTSFKTHFGFNWFIFANLCSFDFWRSFSLIKFSFIIVFCDERIQ